MRLNRGTIVLLVGSIAVIALVLILSNNPALAPGTTTPTPSEQRVGTLFPAVTAETVIRFEVKNYQTGEHTVVTKDSQNIWTVTEATFAAARLTDQATVTEKLGRLVATKYTDRFAPEEVNNYDPAAYGLDKPSYQISMTGSDGTQYTIFVGNKNPGGTRYYTLVNVGPASTPLLPAESTAEATAESTSAPEATPEVSVEVTVEVAAGTPAPVLAPETSDQQVYLLSEFDITTMVALINAPPYEIPTATPTILATPNPFSEVEQTATAAVEQTATAMFTPETTSEATAEVTVEALSVETTDEVEATAAPSNTPVPPSSTPRPSNTPHPASSTPEPTDEPTTAPSRTPRPSSTPRPTATP